MQELRKENCIFSYTEKIITEIVSKHDKATLKAIERYCEENNIIPNIKNIMLTISIINLSLPKGNGFDI